MPLTLYTHPEGWGLPSISPSCIYAEAYLKLAGVEFCRVNCATSSQSPTGQLPAAEKDTAISEGPGNSAGVSGFEAGRSTVAFFKKHVQDLDQELSAVQKAELLAFSSLVESKLEAATEYSCWCEASGFAELKKAGYCGNLPFPLSYFIPLSAQREVRRKYASVSADQVYEGALSALTAVSDRIKSTSGSFFFGAQPSSLDALLAAHLLFYRSSLAAAPALKHKVASLSPLNRYLDHLSSKLFSSATPTTTSRSASMPAPEQPNAWSDAAKGEKSKSTAELTAQEKVMIRNGRLWLFGAGTAIAAYILLCGKYLQVEQLQEVLGAMDDDDDANDED